MDETALEALHVAAAAIKQIPNVTECTADNDHNGGEIIFKVGSTDNEYVLRLDTYDNGEGGDNTTTPPIIAAAPGHSADNFQLTDKDIGVCRRSLRSVVQKQCSGVSHIYYRGITPEKRMLFQVAGRMLTISRRALQQLESCGLCCISTVSGSAPDVDRGLMLFFQLSPQLVATFTYA